jgi:hypothetical protein
MVATLEPRKGRAVALEVFERLRDEGMDIGLSSVNAPDASLAVTAGYRVLSKDGDGTFGEDHGSRIPFVLPPGDSLYMAVEIPSKFKRKGSVFADIGLAQGKAGWWSNSLRVPL